MTSLRFRATITPSDLNSIFIDFTNRNVSASGDLWTQQVISDLLATLHHMVNVTAPDTVGNVIPLHRGSVR